MHKQVGRTWTCLVIGGIILACACAATGIVGVSWLASQTNPPSQPVPANATIGRIAYVGEDGNIYTIAPDGSHQQAVTRDQPASVDQYNALAWSLDGRLAFASSTDEGSALFISQPDGSDRRQVFSGGPDVVPFYLYWSPNGQQLAFLTPSQSNRLALWIAASHDADSAKTIAQGSPSYFSWAPDSRSLLIHIGSVQGAPGETRMAIFNSSQSRLTELPDAPGSFQAPAWSPDNQRFLFIRQADNQTNELVIAEGQDRRALVSSSTGLAFAWSPRGDRIAFATPSPADRLLYSSITILDPGGKEHRIVAQGQIMAFFWSPDGKQLATLNLATNQPEQQGRAILVRAGAVPAPQSADLRLVWSVVNATDGTSVDFPSFHPTDPFLLLLPYFDQYAQSISLWSPDGRYLVYADLDEQDRPSIRVLDTLQLQQPARRLADGTFAAWSWH